MTGKKIKVLLLDNGGEYTDKDFTNFCVKEGIKREWTTPYNPEQNGVAERKNKTIVGATKVMLYDQDLPKYLWAEACNTIVYIQNRTPHRASGKRTPKGVFIGKKPEVSHLKHGLLPHSRREAQQTGSECREGVSRRIRRDLKGIQNLHSWQQEDCSKIGCKVHGRQSFQEIL